MRTPAEIFEDVLRRYDEQNRTRILAQPPGLAQNEELIRHGDEVRALRLEFREASRREPLVGTGSGTVVLTTASPQEAFSGAEEEEANIEGPASQPAEVYDLMSALKASLLQSRPDPFSRRAEHESVPERAERLARRYTRPDGSPR